MYLIFDFDWTLVDSLEIKLITGKFMQNILLTHPSLCCADDIASLCHPLTRFDISYFAHVRITKQGKFSAICNHPDFFEHYIKNSYYNADIHMVDNEIPFNYMLLDAMELSNESKKINQEAVGFGIKHIFTIVSQSRHDSNFYHFATHHSSSFINQIYIANLDLLKVFIAYFNDQMRSSSILSKAYDLTFDLGSSKKPYHFDQIGRMREEFLKEMLSSQSHNNVTSAQNTIIHKSTNEIVSLPSQQHKCLSLLLEGKPAKIIANELHLSQRTVENYIVKIRKLLGAKSSKELICSYYAF